MYFGQSLGFIALIIAIYILWQIRQLILLLLTAVILANALNIIVVKAQIWSNYIFKKLRLPPGWQLPRGQIALITIILFLGTIWLFFSLLIPPFITQFQQLAVKVPQGITALESWLNLIIQELHTRFGLDIDSLTLNLDDTISQLQPIFNQSIGQGLAVFSNSLVILLNGILLLALTLMFLAAPQAYLEGFIRLFPSFYRRRLHQILAVCDRNLKSWLTKTMFRMFGITILSLISLVILQIPLAFSQAMLAGFLTFIPYIGSVLSIIPPVAIALLDTPWKACLVIIFYILIRQIQNHAITPKIIKGQVKFLPAFTLITQLIFAQFFGVLGLFLALPLAVIGKSLIQEIIINDILDPWTINN